MHFEHANTLLGIPLVLVFMMGVFMFHARWRAALIAKLGDGNALHMMFSTFSPTRRRIRTVFFIAAAVLLVIAAAQPQWGQTNRPVKRTGVDVVFAIDISKSMLAKDVAPSRLEAARAEIKTVLSQLGGDRVALVVFTAISFAQSPLTTDYGAIRFYVDKLDPNHMPIGGTSLGRAISDSVQLLTGKSSEGDSGPAMKRAKSQIIVLISDGEDHESDPIAAAELAKSNNIRVVTVGLGSPAGDRIPILRPDGTQAGFQRDRSGEIVRSRLDEKTLQDIAQLTNGHYVRYDGQNSVANAVLGFVDDLEESELELLMKERYRERFYFFLMPAILLLVVGMGLSERRRTSKITTVALIALVLLGTGCEDAFRTTLKDAREAKELTEKSEFDAALETLQRAEEKVPANPELHFNLGLAHYNLAQYDEARSRLARALESPNPELVFDATVNLGLTLGAQERWRDAYETFQDALVIAADNPTKIIEDKILLARHNLEVAFHKMYPPCAELDDEFEENDEPMAATTLEEMKIPKGVICGLDDDWFRVPVIPGTRVSVKTEFTALRDEVDDEVPFITKPEDIQIALFDPIGSHVLVVDQGSPETLESTQKSRRGSRQIDRFLVDETMLNSSSHVLLKISSAASRDYRYSTTIETIPPCFALQEQSEPNNTAELAARLETGPTKAHLCPGDSDWYRISVQPGDSLFVDVLPEMDQERGIPPNPTVQLIDATTLEILSEGFDDNGILAAGKRVFAEAREILVRVGGETEDEQGPYTLEIYQFAPCVVGDDRYEDNDTPDTAAEIDGQMPVHRYLRICENDDDFFKLTLNAKDPRLHLGVALTAFPENPEDPYLSDIQIDHLSDSGDQILHAGQRPDEVSPGAIPLRSVVVSNTLQEPSAIVRVRGEPDFYHLVQLNPTTPPPNEPQDSQDKEQNDDSQEQDGENQEEKEDEQTPKDDENQKEEEEKSEQADEQQPEPEEEQPAQDAQPRDTSEDPEMQRIDDILEALENSDHNFQMKKALENVPNRYIERDW